MRSSDFEDFEAHAELARRLDRADRELEANMDPRDLGASAYLQIRRGVISKFCAERPKFVLDEELLRRCGH